MQGITPTDSVFDHSSDIAKPLGSGFLFSETDPKSGPVVSEPFARRPSTPGSSPRKTPPRLGSVLIAACLLILVLGGLVGGISWLRGRHPASTAQAPALPTRSSVLSDLFQPQEAFTIQGSDASKLAIFGTGGSTTLAFAAPQGTNTITMPAASGTICLDSNNCQFVRQVDLAQNIAMQGGPGVTLTDRTISNSGVLAVNGLAGRLSIQGTTSQVTVTTTGNSIALSGPQDLAAASSPTFAGLTVTSNVSIAGMTYNWPTSSTAGVLSNNGSGTLSWAPVGACASCATNGGNSFGSTFSLGTNDAQDLALVAGGITRLTVSNAGTSTFTGPVVASSFSGDGTSVSNVDAITLGGSGGSYYTNASNLSSGTVSDTRLSGNVALLNAANTFLVGQTIQSGAAGTKGLVVQGAASQTANLQEWQVSDGSVRAYFDSTGRLQLSNGLSNSIGAPIGASMLGITAGSAAYIPLAVRGANSQTANLQEWQNSAGTAYLSVLPTGTIYQPVNNASMIYQSWGNTIRSGTTGPTGSVHNLLRMYSADGDLEFGVYNPSKYLTVNSHVAIGAAKAGTGMLEVTNLTASQVGVWIKGAAAQTANLQEWQSSTGTVLSFIDASGNLSVKAATVDGNLTVNGHYISGNTSGSTTIAAGAGSGTGPSVSIAGNDTSGTATITTGTTPSAGILATITFANAYGSAPRVILTAGNAATTGLQIYRGSGTTTFTISSNNAPTASTTYTFDYQVMQ